MEAIIHFILMPIFWIPVVGILAFLTYRNYKKINKLKLSEKELKHIMENDVIKIQSIVVIFIPALLQTAVDEQFVSVDFQTVTAAGNGFGSTEKRKFHIKASFSFII